MNPPATGANRGRRLTRVEETSAGGFVLAQDGSLRVALIGRETRSGRIDWCVPKGHPEGVETIDEWQLLAQLGCTYAQGYLISAPVPGEQLPDAIQRWRQTHH